jgi:ribosomal protein S27AE
MAASKASILSVLSRSLRLLCPACGQSFIASGPFRIRHHCPKCHSLFKREEGFFVGAILANVMTTELTILLCSVIWLTVIGSNYESVLAGLFVVALVFPVVFYHHSWSLWLGFDYLIEGLPGYDKPRSGIDLDNGS